MSAKDPSGPRTRLGGIAAVAVLLGGLATLVVESTAVANPGTRAEYTVIAADGVANATAVAAIERAGGRVIERNDTVGLFRVVTEDPDFVERAVASPSLVGAANRVPVGRAPARRPGLIDVDGEVPATDRTGPPTGAATAGDAATDTSTGMDPLDEKLWGLRMVRSDLARQVTAGDRGVTVGIVDTGVDASNPDLAKNFSWTMSRNFAPDIPEIDGPCEVASCLDPVGTDDGGHGTHVAGTIGAAADGVGISGVAPNVTLVELKVGQDSGFFFLEPVVNALTYAGDAGIDVLNMSFFVDPWLYNCRANPADSPRAQAEQRTIIAAITRAMTYAHAHGVTLLTSAGNNHEDLGDPREDVISPDYPADAAYPRPIDNRSCLTLPTEGPFAISVSALGPSGRKADYSNYGIEQVKLAAPGGWVRDGFGTPTYNTRANAVLSTYPLKVLQELGMVDADGVITPAGAGRVFTDCTAEGACGYYTYLQGTSMASPHAAGVAALIVSRYGHRDPHRPGTLRMSPSAVERVLLSTAAKHACPEPRLQTYTNEGRPAEYDAYCAGGPAFNGFYGFGIVDAYAAVTNH